MANQRGETTSIGHFYNRCIDAVNNLFDTMSFWTHSKDVEFVDGKTAETKVGAINGITSDMSGEADDIAASIKCVNQLNSSLIGLAMLPDYSQKENLNLSIGDSYTASKNGYLFITAKGTSGQAISLLHDSDYIIGNSISGTNYVASVQAPMVKGDTLSIGGNATSIYSSYFVPAKN